MESIVDLAEVARSYVFSYALSTGRYILAAGALYLLIWKGFSVFLAKSKIPNKYSNPAEARLEFFLTMGNLLIFSLVGVAVGLIKKTTGYSAIYTSFSDYGAVWFVASIFLAAAFTDTYFYWFHRFIHQPAIYRKVHKLHHRFTNPTPWSAYSLDIVEGSVLAFSFFIVLMVIPMHPVAILIYTSYAIFWNAFIHLGYEIFPTRWQQNFLLKWINTSTHHHHHHQFFNSNYSLYFTFWDRLMKTENPKTVETFQLH